MKFNANKLKELSRPLSAAEKDELEFRNDNREWLAISERLALKIRRILREKFPNMNLQKKWEFHLLRLLKY